MNKAQAIELLEITGFSVDDARSLCEEARDYGNAVYGDSGIRVDCEGENYTVSAG